MDRILILVTAGLMVGLAVAGGQAMARRRFAHLTASGPSVLWRALGQRPDGRPTVVVFSTPSCGACKSAQRPAIAALEALSEGGIRVIPVDAARDRSIARAFGILTVPATVVLDAHGMVLAANHGFAPLGRLAIQLGLAGEPVATA
ncbi:MAG TPA: thioredoxin family protein [Candidatus Dormibacteraeota bacterium]|jgi:thiol-disulfide isomerase/thioredoxin|nr:thioredoxin family protein [Candidatus Dormibacteraeota bacterium]